MSNLGPSFLDKVERNTFVNAERDRISRRIQSLRSKQQTVGPFRQAGIQLSIDGLKAELQKVAELKS